MKIKPKTKYGIGFWIIKVIRSCTNLKQLEGASRLIRSFEQNPKYSPPWELVCEIDRIALIILEYFFGFFISSAT